MIHIVRNIFLLIFSITAFTGVSKAQDNYKKTVMKFNSFNIYNNTKNGDLKYIGSKKFNTVFSITASQISYILGDKKFTFIINRYDIIDKTTIQYYTHNKKNPTYSSLILVGADYIAMIDNETTIKYVNKDATK